MHWISQKRWIILPVLLVLLFVLNLGMGSVHIPAGTILSILSGSETVDPVWRDIVWEFRMTKALTCILAGSALAIAGLQMQTLFRNALAGPDVLGLSSGASLAVSLVIMSQAAGLKILSTPSPWAIAAAASLGCCGVFLVVMFIAQRLRDNTSLLIIGLMMGAATSSLVSVLQFLSRPEQQQSYMLWTFGSLGQLNWAEIQVLTAILITAGVVAFFSTKALNGWLLGDNYAQSIGIRLRRSRMIILLATSLLTGGVTAFCGPIAFVGLAVPHLTKLLIKTHNHKVLIPAVSVAGGALMLFCDIVTQLPGSAYVLPINAITAMVGAPVVIWIILRAKRLSV
jgi:iron complex transport system permease protein